MSIWQLQLELAIDKGFSVFFLCEQLLSKPVESQIVIPEIVISGNFREHLWMVSCRGEQIYTSYFETNFEMIRAALACTP